MMLRIGLTQTGVLELPGWSARMLLLGLTDAEDGPVRARIVSDVAYEPCPGRFEASAAEGESVELLPGRMFQVRSISEHMVFLDEV